MQYYLVSPTYVTTEPSISPRVGYIHPTRGRSVKFISSVHTDFVRYAKTSEDLHDINLSFVGPDNDNVQVGYIIVSGESLRYLIDSIPDDSLGAFEYFKTDNLVKGPIIRLHCEPYQADYDENGQRTVYVKLPVRSGELSMKIVGLSIQDIKIEQADSLTPSDDEWWEQLKKIDRCSGDRKITGVGYASDCSKTDNAPPLSIDQILDDYATGVNDYFKQKQKPKKENKNMNLGTNLFKDLSFGKASSSFALSFDNHITFNGKYYADGSLNDACGLTLDLDGLLYVMPTQELKTGDIIYKKGVDAYYYDGTSYISLTTGQKAEYVPTKVFGMTFYSVVKNLAGNMFGADASKNNPMANMLPFLLLDRDGDNDDLLKFMLLSQGNFNFLQPQPATKPESK